ncbi:MAG: hypothetical protein N3B10_04625, partial [Armatimonadetes bacterium]|nr:hypothetical protein [Armatimonadota bacterium]
GISLHLGYQVFRTAIAFAFLLTAYWFSGLFFRSERTRFSFLLVLSLSSGFGWLMVLLWWLTKQRPPFFFVDVSPELTMPEANSFLSLTVAPLAASGVTLVMLSLGCLLTGLQFRRDLAFRFITLATIFGILVVNVHTYAAIPMLVAVVLWQFAEAFKSKSIHLRQLVSAILFCFFVALFLFGQAAFFSRDPAFAQKAATPTLTPNPIILIGSYGFIALGALLGLPIALRERLSGRKEWAVPIAWLVAILLAIHLPVSFQRKMIEGLHVVLCLLTVLAIERASAQEFKRGSVKECKSDVKKTQSVQKLTRMHAYTLALLVASVPSQIAFFALNGYWLVHNNMVYDERFNPPYSRMLMPPYFLSERHLQLFRWLEKHTRSDEAILCHPMLGNYLPVLTGRRVFVGHWAETLNFGTKLKLAMAVWRGVIPTDEARETFQHHKIRYALETDFERLASDGQCELERYGEVVFQLGGDRVFRLNW